MITLLILCRLKWYPLSNSEDVRVRAIPGKDTSVDITNLHPGVDYMFEITTEAHNLRSAKKQVGIRTMPLILSDITLINQQEVTTALTLRSVVQNVNADFYLPQYYLARD